MAAARPHIDDWRQAFRGSVMRTGMELRLSQPMLEHLCAISDNVWADKTRGNCNFIATAAALEKRGIITHNPSRSKNGDGFGRAWVVTPIGELVVAMLREAGIFYQADEAIQKRMGGRR